MGKMGGGAKTGTAGAPVTPRDGAPVEIIGLLFSILRWLSGVRRREVPFEGAVMLQVSRFSTAVYPADLLHHGGTLINTPMHLSFRSME